MHTACTGTEHPLWARETVHPVAGLFMLQMLGAHGRGCHRLFEIPFPNTLAHSFSIQHIQHRHPLPYEASLDFCSRGINLRAQRQGRALLVGDRGRIVWLECWMHCVEAVKGLERQEMDLRCCREFASIVVVRMSCKASSAFS